MGGKWCQRETVGGDQDGPMCDKWDNYMKRGTGITNKVADLTSLFCVFKNLPRKERAFNIHS